MKHQYYVKIEPVNGGFGVPLANINLIMSTSDVKELIEKYIEKLPEESKGRMTLENYIKVWLT